MIKFFFILLILFGLSGCITAEEKSFVSKEANNDETKTGLSQNKFKNSVEEYKFIQWKCYKYHWLIKYKELISTVGYFPEFKKFDQNNQIGMLLINNKKLAIYSQKGVQHYWDWGGKNFNNYQLIIHPSGKGWFYDFENAKSNELKSPKETYDCKPLNTTFITINDMDNIIKKLHYVPNFDRRDFKNILQIHLQKCFKINFPTTKILKDYPTVTLQIFTNKDGVINKTNFLNKKKYEDDINYKIIADIASKSVMNCSHLPIHQKKMGLYKSFLMDFNPKFILEK